MRVHADVVSINKNKSYKEVWVRIVEEAIKQPMSLEEMLAIVGKFPFKAKKVVDIDPPKDKIQIRIPLESEVTVTKRKNKKYFIIDTGAPELSQTNGQIKKWRFP